LRTSRDRGEQQGSFMFVSYSTLSVGDTCTAKDLYSSSPRDEGHLIKNVQDV